MRAAVPSLTGDEIETMDYRDWRRYAEITEAWMARHHLGGGGGGT
jgi:hypothetical protein